ncbi:MAG TPA: hypothetical protein VG708_06030 [Mycobacteriales bacterium]|jgi:hypothetical protein|nr:hypothetical protein [Mycobacteriales bacterium]
MIVRILGEGQLDVPAHGLDELNALDEKVQKACDADDQAAFTEALGALLARVRELGKPLPDDTLTPSELVLPAADSSLAEVAALLADDGLIPG